MRERRVHCPSDFALDRVRQALSVLLRNEPNRPIHYLCFVFPILAVPLVGIYHEKKHQTSKCKDVCMNMFSLLFITMSYLHQKAK